MSDSPDLEKYRHYLRLLAQTHLGQAGRGKIDPSDIVQQTMLEAHKRRDCLEGRADGEAAAWLRQLLAWNLSDALRKLHRGKRDMEKELRQRLDATSIRMEQMLAADITSPSGRVANKEHALRLAECLARLPDDYREVLVLRHCEGWPLQQISEHMARTQRSVAGLLQRGMEQLRELMSDGPT